jgi:adenosylhomocysteine nucleosidase
MATELISSAPAIMVPCVVFALRRESMYFRRAYPFRQHFFGAPCHAQFCDSQEWGGKGKPERFSPKTGPDGFVRADTFTRYYFRPSVLMLETGVGAASMATALHWCLSGPRFAGMPYRPRLLVSVGFSGALQPEQRVGDLVLATEVVDQHGQRWPALRPAAWVNRDITAGRLLTVPELVSDPQEKQRLGRQYEALAVDMESAVAARFCHEHKVPFACLRVISDDWQTALSPHLVELLRQERVSPARLAGRVLRHPKLIGELWRLARHTRQASWRLFSPLSAILTNASEFV